VISTDTYHSHRPDIIVSIITSQTADAITPLDYILRDWAAAGLHRASAFRMFLATLPVTAARIIGHCSERDWQAIQDCLTRGIAFS
jgi:mRNA interferase MazF